MKSLFTNKPEIDRQKLRTTIVELIFLFQAHLPLVLVIILSVLMLLFLGLLYQKYTVMGGRECWVINSSMNKLFPPSGHCSVVCIMFPLFPWKTNRLMSNNNHHLLLFKFPQLNSSNWLNIINFCLVSSFFFFFIAFYHVIKWFSVSCLAISLFRFQTVYFNGRRQNWLITL